MSSLATQAAETFQTAHLRRNPDPHHDINPSKRSPASLGVDSDSEDDDTTYAIQKPQTKPFPPIPDLRFEQSYLHSISKAETWWEVLFITVKDQVAFPLLQGFLWNLTLCGWQAWNRNARVHGNTVGARVRRWWYGVNNWRIPPAPRINGLKTI
ncbi:hypothetical protein SAPIO_CDS7680 [Scedosporium apiospermum]|uniref:DUF1770-domain-containing protein n=1 Tax=Pseudallescheria apiosperma TaxID=563466 RepID=A0A084G2F9_PSEDA|nr:uncharacterized protein SAPIO_CDS7680 [Scedosporium apiospermum]KEZ41521.1 hypothetical protein SAPIO_CDS7680 [Scedosporium apiospermum]